LVADAVEWGENLAAELAGLFENSGDQIGRRVGEAGHVVVTLDVEHVVDEEQGIVNGRLIGRHGFTPRLSRGRPALPESAGSPARARLWRDRFRRAAPRAAPSVPGIWREPPEAGYVARRRGRRGRASRAPLRARSRRACPSARNAAARGRAGCRAAARRCGAPQATPFPHRSATSARSPRTPW